MLDEESEELSVVEDSGPSMDTSNRPPAAPAQPANMLPENEMSSADDEPVASILYIPSGVLPKLARYMNRIIEIRIPAKYLSSKNKEVQTRQLWGTNVYTDDSDAVAILQHTASYILRPNPPSNTAGMSAFFRVLPGLAEYPAVERFGIRSRAWTQQYPRCSLKMIRAEHIEGNVNQLPKGGKEVSASSSSFFSSFHASKDSAAAQSAASQKNKEGKLIKMLIVEKPPVKSSGKSKRKNIPDVSIMSSANWFEPAWKYSLGFFGDKGMEVADWTSGRFRKEVAYFQHQGVEYELCREENAGINGFDRYRFSQILNNEQLVAAQDAAINAAMQAASAPPPAKRGRTSAASSASSAAPVAPALSSFSIRSQIPMHSRYVKVLEKELDWEQLEWGPSSIRIKGKEYPISTMNFRAIASP